MDESPFTCWLFHGGNDAPQCEFRVRKAVTDCELDWHSRGVRSRRAHGLAGDASGGSGTGRNAARCSVTSPTRAAARVPGATVTAVETQTNISRTAVTNEAGNYIFSSLRNGTYSVEAELTGFRKVMRQNVRVDVNTTMRVDLTLELGR